MIFGYQIFGSTRLHRHRAKLLTIMAFRGQNSIAAKYWSLNIVPCHVLLPTFGSGKYIVACGLFGDQICVWSSIPNATNLWEPNVFGLGRNLRPKSRQSAINFLVSEGENFCRRFVIYLSWPYTCIKCEFKCLTSFNPT